MRRAEALNRTFRTSRANFSTQPVAAIELSMPICASEREKSVCHKSFEDNRFRQMCGTGGTGNWNRQRYRPSLSGATALTNTTTPLSLPLLKLRDHPDRDAT